MEPDSSGGPATENRAAPTHAGGVLIICLAAVLTLGALGYFYLNRDTGTETASAPATEQAPVRKDVAAAPPAAEPVRPPPAPPQQAASPAASTAPPAQTPPPAPVVTATPAQTPPPAPVVTATPSTPARLAPPPGAERPAAQTATPAQTQAPAQPPTPAQVQPPAQAQAPTNSAPAENATPRQPDPLRNQPASLPAADVVFVQKPGVNIRAEPRRRARVVGSASKGQQFKVVGRTGSWVHVEGDGRKGWIGSRMVGPQSP